MRLALPALVLALCAGLLAGPAEAEIRALIVTAGHYDSAGIASLDGPPNDSAALRRMLVEEGAQDVVVLSEAQVTRTSVRTALQGLGARAQPGDWVVFFYAGHAAQAKARSADEADGLDEFLVLPGFDVVHPDPEQFVLDDELLGWLVNFFPASVNVMQIADTCHSGTLNRALSPKSGFKTRQGLKDPLSIRLPEPPSDPMAQAGRVGDPPNLIYVGASQDDQFALEAPLPRGDSPARGLLTFALEGALRDRVDGRLAADRDGDGRLTLSELSATLEVRTREYSGAQQWASVHLPPGNERTVVFQPLAAIPDDDPPIRVQAADEDAARILSGRGPWASLVIGEPDLTWSARGGVVTDARGDLIAEGLMSGDGIAAVIAKQQAMTTLYRLADERRVQVKVGPLKRGQIYRNGDPVELSVSHDGPAAYLTVFNLAGDGTVQLLYPLDGDGPGLLADGPVTTSLSSTRAAPPFGVDHVIAVTTAADPALLRGALGRSAGKREAAAVAAAVREQFKSAAGALAVGELYTGR